MSEEITIIDDDIIEEDTAEVSSSDDIEESVNEESEEIEIIVDDEVDVDETETIVDDETDVDETETIVDDETDIDETETSADDETDIDETETSTELESINIFSDTSYMDDYTELYQAMIVEQQTTNELLFRINEQNDFIIGVGCALIISMVAYSILEKFCRF